MNVKEQARVALVVVSVALSLTACTTNPYTGEREATKTARACSFTFIEPSPLNSSDHLAMLQPGP